jgi:tetratricopeptide (TPR) repeat protein
VSAAESAARERPADPQAAVLLAQTLRAQGNVDRAARELTRRIADQPDAAPLHVEMGWLSLHRKEPAAARASFHEALRRDSRSAEARHGIIAAHIAEQKIDAARAQAQEWMTAAPSDAALRVLAARVELAAGDAPAAERLLTAVIAADPGQLDAYELLGRTYVAQGRADLAVQQYDALAQRSPDKAVGARTMVGMLHEARNDRAAARAAYEQALSLDSKAGVAANNLAWMYIHEGKLDEALRLAEVARDALRLRPEPEDTLGWVYLQKGLATQAIASFTRARERAPQNAVYHYHLGLAYLKNGENDRARDALARALDLGRDFAGVEDARTKLAALSDAKSETRP